MWGLSLRIPILASVIFVAAFGIEIEPCQGNGASGPPYSSEIATDSKRQSVDLSDNQSSAVIGSLKFSLESKRTGREAWHLAVECVPKSGTSELKIDPDSYGSGAKLINLTRTVEGDCDSYEVSFAAVERPDGKLSGVLDPPSIAVGAHYAGPPGLAEKVSSPAVFVFNPVHGNWTEAKPYVPSTAEPSRTYATLRQQSQRIIVGVVVTPQSSSATPTKLSADSISRPIDGVAPTNGYLSIEQVQPDPKGAFQVPLPLLLRPSRGPGPSFSITYDPQGRPGVLGRGWHLRLSSITIRGPAPLYHPNFETEDYLLDGEDLIALDDKGKDLPPLYKGGPIVPRVSKVRYFRPRNNTEGLIVRRYRDTPSSYFWEVWNPHTGTTRLYGGYIAPPNPIPAPHSDDPIPAPYGDGLLRGTALYSGGLQRAAIGEWGLTEEYDNQPAHNGAKYSYFQVDPKNPGDRSDRDCSDYWKNYCSSALRLKSVQYNLAFGEPNDGASLSGVTSVEFTWIPRDVKRFNSDGRLGFLRASEYWLTEITVSYRPEQTNAWLVASASDYRKKLEQDNGNSKLAAAIDFRVPSGLTLFAQHQFEPFYSNDIDKSADCANSDVYLASYSVTANPLYDLSNDLASQRFKFTYKGGQTDEHGNCAPEQWQSEPLTSFGAVPAAAPGGPFPAGLLNGLGFGRLTSASLLGTSQSTEAGASLYAGVGPNDGNTSSKSNTGGFKAGVDFSQSDGTSTLVDITGSGIPAIVYRDQNHLAYCTGVREPGVREPISAPGVPHRVRYYTDRCGTIEGVDSFSFSTSSNQSLGVEGYFGSNVFAGVSFSQSQNQTFTYFADADGDGLIDIVDHGQVYYNQGEVLDNGRRVVRFAPNSALRPPVPGRSKSSGAAATSAAVAATHVPQELRDTVQSIESRLGDVARRLHDLEYSQTTIAWEAPLDGQITLSGHFQSAVSGVETGNEGALGDFGPRQFDDLYLRSQTYQRYVVAKLNCSVWPEDQHCYDQFSDPFAPHFVQYTNDIKFLAAPQSRIQIFLSRANASNTISCSDAPVYVTGVDLSSIPIADACHASGDTPGLIRVKATDVIYITYSVHPSQQAFVLPEATISYSSVDDDAVFNAYRKRGPDALPPEVACRFAEEGGALPQDNCLLSKQRRYSFKLSEGLIASSTTAQVRVPAGSDRQIGGALRLPADLVSEYQVNFEVVGIAAEPDSQSPAQAGSATQRGSPSGDTHYSNTVPTASLSPLFRQDVSISCADSGPECTIPISVNCVAGANCNAFLATGLNGSAYYLASRLTFQHKAVSPQIAVQGIGNRVASVVWLEPPHVTSSTTEVAPTSATLAAGGAAINPVQEKKPTVYYLPIAMGEPDLNYFRVEKGTFANPDQELEEGLRGSSTISFERMLADERESVNLARLRQTHHLCLIGAELVEFLAVRAVDYSTPYADDYDSYWKSRFAAHKTRCDAAEYDIGRYGFINGEKPEKLTDNSLNLIQLLKNLSNVEQRTSAETLLERVLGNLRLDQEFLTDSPRVTRRGYRLPVKVNPLDCYRVSDSRAEIPWSDQPVSRPIFGSETSCSYRLSTNFAMQDLSEFRDVLSPAQIDNIRTILERFKSSNTPAFKIELTATVNGSPIAFRELSGAQTGNEGCGDQRGAPTDLFTTCMGSYGTIGPDNYRYPAPKGDLFERLTLNKRIGRAVAFGNSIMDVGQDISALCPRVYPPFSDLHSMELKQDCLPPNSRINADEKYVGSPKYTIEYTIGENNQFNGRNSVLEFRASPLDLVEFHYRISAAESFVDGNRTGEKISGKFSILDTGDPHYKPDGLASGRHMIPRSPSQILSDARVTPDEFRCPQAPPPAGRGSTGDNRLTASCRPWTRLGWTEIIFGAQYRTYSDAQATGIGHTFSVERRRENLRLSPEIEVDASGYEIVDTTSRFLPLVTEKTPNQSDHQFRVLEANDPNVPKLGGLWAFFAGRSDQSQPLQTPPAFASLRYDRELVPPPNSGDYQTSYKACGTKDNPDLDGCQNNLGSTGENELSLRKVKVFALEHRFIGPATAAGLKKFQDSASSTILPPTGRCSAELVTATTSCWIGVDDTIFFEAAISPATPSGTRPDARSVSALLGFERPPIAEYRSLFDSYVKLVCLDSAGPTGQCPTHTVTAVAGTNQFAYPNRPEPPAVAQQVPTYAPVLASEARSVAFNAGAGPINTSVVKTGKQTTVQFLDVAGTGFPSAVTNGAAELMSPVGISRSDWWRYYRSDDGRPGLGAEATGVGADQNSTSISIGAGAGLSPSTANLFRDRGSQTRVSGSSDANVEPGFDFGMERGNDETFTQMIDLKGDGLPDKITGSTIGQGLSVTFNVGSSLRNCRQSNGQDPCVVSNAVSANGAPASGRYFNTNHSQGFGIRLGYSTDSGSFVAGMGLSDHAAGSDVALVDFAGHGRPDIVVADGSEGIITFPNLGNGFGKALSHKLPGFKLRTEPGAESGTRMSETTLLDAGVNFTFGFEAWYVKIVFTPGVKWTRNQTRELIGIVDVNGDGAPDVVTVSGAFLPDNSGVLSLDPSSVQTKIYYNPLVTSHLLSSIENPSGSRLELHYGLRGNTGPELGRPVWALTGVAKFDGYIQQSTDGPAGAGRTARGQNVQLTTYEYRKGYFNRAEKQFYGFAERDTTTYGCELTDQRSTCLDIVRSDDELTPESLSNAGFRRLQVVRQEFSNLDYLTQGLELSRVVLGITSSPDPITQSEAPKPAEVVSRTTNRYSIDVLVSLIPEDVGDCVGSTGARSPYSWSKGDYDYGGSGLSNSASGKKFFDQGKVLGSNSICGIDVANCDATLRTRMCQSGFKHEQSAFWAQQSATVRPRFVALETFGDKVPESLIDNSDVPRLRSALGFDHDQWGQVLRLNEVGEASSRWKPAADASVHASVSYARLQGPSGLEKSRPSSPLFRRRWSYGYPLLDLPNDIEVFSSPWSDADGGTVPLRVREALHRTDGSGNLSDICLYPGGIGFHFVKGICGGYRRNLLSALGEGYSSMQTALRRAYDETDGLPKGEDEFNAIIHHRFVDYDQYGNLTHAISPPSANKEWIERRFDYGDDPFRKTATYTSLTRCVADTPGAGADSPNIVNGRDYGCEFGLKSVPAPIARRSITHVSKTVVEPHFGLAAKTEDVNGNSTLVDFDRWGRFDLIARSWGNVPPENATFKDRVKLAAQKLGGSVAPAAKDWRLLALADYDQVKDIEESPKIVSGLLRSNVRRVEPSDSYSGLLGAGKTMRETAMFADGLGRPVQSIREADVCLGVHDGLILGSGNEPFTADLQERCTMTSTGVVTPATKFDALGRGLQTFESYSLPGAVKIHNGSDLRLLQPIGAPTSAKLEPVASTTYDGAGRLLLVESRLSKPDVVGSVLGASQSLYRVVPETGERLARFEALSLSPRCTASASWSDARGLKRTIFEEQKKFYQGVGPATTPPTAAGYARNYDETRGYCLPIGQMAKPDDFTFSDDWYKSEVASLASKSLQPSRVMYDYDPLEQILAVDYPLDKSSRGETMAHYDLVGRMLELDDPDSGCVRRDYDGLNNLSSETGFKFEPEFGKGCGATSKVRNRKSYGYSGGRLLEMTYHSLENQGGMEDQRDAVRFYYDRYPHAVKFGEVLETRRLVPNDQANQRFIDATGRVCANCIEEVTTVSDRTGARSFAYNELGLAKRETRSIVAPLRDSALVKQSEGTSETYLPEIAFFRQDNSYTAFGDPTEERLTESSPMNPALKCIENNAQAGVDTCLAQFSIGRRYSPDGALAQMLFNGKPMITAANDDLGRPAVRWTSNGVATGYRYDPFDLRLNQITTLTAANANVAVQIGGYQYDGGGNILSYDNKATAGQNYESQFAFVYDAANRVKNFTADACKGAALPSCNGGAFMHANGEDNFDPGHRFVSRVLNISGTPGVSLSRKWAYSYDNPGASPAHAPSLVAFTLNGGPTRREALGYDDLGRMTRIGARDAEAEQAPGLLSNRLMAWDAESRLRRVRGVDDVKAPANDSLLREEYIYDFSGNRTLKIDRPWNSDKKQTDEGATVYATPFYARPFDARGTVELSQGSLPIAILSPPVNENEVPTTRYLYSDLPSGSATSAVTVAGEPSKADSTSVVRREYAPFGLELTSEELASSKDDASHLPSVFHGKELDHVTNFSSFGARYYSRDLGVWLSSDPMLQSYWAGAPNGGVYAPSNLSSYAYVRNSPINFSDPSGEWAILDDVIATGGGAVAGVVIQGGFDLYAGRLSSWRTYAAGAAAGAAGGEAALYSGGAGSGAAAGFTHSLVDQLLNEGHVSAGKVAFETGAGFVLGGASSRAWAATAGIRSTALSSLRGVIGESVTARSPMLGNKLAYFLGEATGSAHNIERSTTMARQLSRIGLWNNTETQTYLTQHLTDLLKDDANILMTQSNGRIVRESLLPGPGGFLKWRTVWEQNSLITGTFFGGP
jgi:RHS repeat-associated protein